MAVKVNPGRINQQDMMNAQAYTGIMSKIEKLGKGKRKYKLFFDKTAKKYFGKMVKEFSKQLQGYQNNPQTKNVIEFYSYIELETAKAANQPIMVSFEELEFLKGTMSETIKGMEKVQYKWYDIFRKVLTKTMIKQNKIILEELKK